MRGDGRPADTGARPNRGFGRLGIRTEGSSASMWSSGDIAGESTPGRDPTGTRRCTACAPTRSARERTRGWDAPRARRSARRPEAAGRSVPRDPPPHRPGRVAPGRRHHGRRREPGRRARRRGSAPTRVSCSQPRFMPKTAQPCSTGRWAMTVLRGSPLRRPWSSAPAPAGPRRAAATASFARRMRAARRHGDAAACEARQSERYTGEAVEASGRHAHIVAPAKVSRHIAGHIQRGGGTAR